MNGPEVATMGQQDLELLKDERITGKDTHVSPPTASPKQELSEQQPNGEASLQTSTVSETTDTEIQQPKPEPALEPATPAPEPAPAHEPTPTQTPPVPSQASPTAQPVIKKIRLKIGGSTTAATIPVPINYTSPTSPAVNNGPPTPISSPLPSPYVNTEIEYAPASASAPQPHATQRAAPARTARPKKKPQKKRRKRRSESPDYDESPTIRPRRRRRKTQKMREMDDGDEEEEEWDFDDEEEEEEENWDEKDQEVDLVQQPTEEQVEDPYGSDEDDTCSICKQGYKGKFMLDCDRCHMWFHGTCVGVDPEDPPSKWLCDTCMEAIEERKRQVKQRQKQISTVGMVTYINELKEGLRALTEDLRVIKQMQEQEEPEPQVEEEWDFGGYESPPKKAPKKKKSKSHTPMTRQEKQKLNEDLSKLPQQKLFRVINLINEKMPTALNSMNDEISIDLESLDTETLRSVERLVKLLSVNRKKNTQQQR